MSRKIIAVKPLNDRLIFFNPHSSRFEEVPGGAPHGHGFTINEVFYRVHEGQDITELVGRVYGPACEVNTLRIKASRYTAIFLRAFAARVRTLFMSSIVGEAKELLTSGKLSIIEIAHRLGFADQSHLTRHLKHIFGIIPKRQDVEQDSSKEPQEHPRVRRA